MMMKKYYIAASTFCMERMLDAQKVSNYLKINGWVPVRKAAQADLIFISTCSFGKEEDASSLDYIQHYFRKKKPSAQVIVAGCIPAINPAALAQLGEFETLSPTSLARIDDLVHPQVKFKEIKEPNIISATEVIHSIVFKKYLWFRSLRQYLFTRYKLSLDYFRAWGKVLAGAIRYIPIMKSHINPFLACNRNEFYYLRISKGCLGDCSYCAKKYSTGRLKSKDLAAILAEFKTGLEAGHQKFYLLTEDTGCYGMDQGQSLVNLLGKIFEQADGADFQIVLSNLNARWLVKHYDRLEPLLVKNQDKILYVQIPIQSGSSRMLKQMNRHYGIEEVRRCLADLRQKVPGIALTTDMIVGFPGETDEDFQMTKEFLSDIRFDYVDIFGYEQRPNTKAADMSEQVSQTVIGQRVRELAQLQISMNKRNFLPKKIMEVTRENLQRYKLKEIH